MSRRPAAHAPGGTKHQPVPLQLGQQQQHLIERSSEVKWIRWIVVLYRQQPPPCCTILYYTTLYPTLSTPLYTSSLYYSDNTLSYPPFFFFTSLHFSLYHSDNTLLGGRTIDYGPFGWMEKYDPFYQVRKILRTVRSSCEMSRILIQQNYTNNEIIWFVWNIKIFVQ